MKRSLAIVALLFLMLYAYGDVIEDSSFLHSNALILSFGGPVASPLYQTLPLIRINMGFQHIFKNFGFSASVTAITLEASGYDYPEEWENEDGYVFVRQIQMSLKPIIIIKTLGQDRKLNAMLYSFGVVVFKDQFAKKYEKYSIVEFRPYQVGFGLGFDAMLFKHFATFIEASYYNTGEELSDQEYSNKRLDHYYYEVVKEMKPTIEFGFKVYL